MDEKGMPRRRHRRSREHKVHCWRTGKVRNRDEHDAGLALRGLKRVRARAEADGGAHRIQVTRKYECGACGGWHLTSWLSPTERAAGDV